MPKEIPEIDAAHRAEWEQLQRKDARAASAYYFREILSAVVSHHQKQAGPLAECELLVSLMGFSPETTVLAVAFVRPRRLVILASKNGASYCEQCVDFLAEHGLVAREAVSIRFVEPTDHVALYAALNDALVPATGRRLVDLTGGKKIMSAVAGFAAWRLGIPVCYLESRAYNEQTRRPEPGSEELITLNSPAAPGC